MAKSKKKAPGYYWYFDDWAGDPGVQRLGYAAKGLWRDMLDLMHQVKPAGVLPGRLVHLAPLMGYALPSVAKAWADEVAPLIRELEVAGVLSRGFEVSDERDRLPDDAIVCRKIYRNWLKAERRSRKAEHAAHARWEREADKKAAHEEPQNLPDIEYEPMLDPMLNPMLDPMLRACSPLCSRETVTPDERTTSGDPLMLAGCRSQTQTQTLPSSITRSPQNPKRDNAGTKPLPLGSLDLDKYLPDQNPASAEQNNFDLLAMEVTRVAKSPDLTRGLWRARLVHINERPHLRGRMLDELERIEKETNPRLAQGRGSAAISNPGALVNIAIRTLADTQKGA